MRYRRDHKPRTRNRIIEKTSLGLREGGIGGLSIPDLMKLAGLTHGGFYNHFKSREALVAASVLFAMDRTTSSWTQLVGSKPENERFDAIVDNYLSSRHREDHKNGCVVPALGADIARAGPKLRRAFARQLEAMIGVMADQLQTLPAAAAREAAMAAFATMVGTIVLARAAGSKMLSEEIISAGRKAVQKGKCEPAS
jgi:TetR/AcrR family transcriptional repressor of nem operon